MLDSCRDEKKRNEEIQSLQLQLKEVQDPLQSLHRQRQTLLREIQSYFTVLSQVPIPFQSPSFHSFSSLVSSYSSSQWDEEMYDHVMETIKEIQAEVWNKIKSARLELYSSILSHKTIDYLCDEEKRQSENNSNNTNKVTYGFLGMVVEQFRMDSSTSWKVFEKCFHQLLSPYFSVLLCNTYTDAKVKSYYFLHYHFKRPIPSFSLYI